LLSKVASVVTKLAENGSDPITAASARLSFGGAAAIAGDAVASATLKQATDNPDFNTSTS
jgi:hypothetical protein